MSYSAPVVDVSPLSSTDDPAVTRSAAGAGAGAPSRSFWLAVSVAVVVRVVYLASKWTDPLLVNDSLYYSRQASKVAAGLGFQEPFTDRPGAEHGPLTALLLAPFSRGDDPVRWQRLATMLAGIGAVVVIGFLARRIAGPRAAVVAVGVAALYPNLWMNDGLVMSESIGCLVLALALLCFARWIDDGSGVDLLAAGALLGLAGLARSEMLLALPILAVVVAWRGRADRGRAVGRAAVFVLAGFVVLVPWTVYNLSRFDRPVLLTTNDGTTLLGANCDDAYRGSAVGGWSLFCVLDDPGAVPDEEASVRSARQRDAAVRYAIDNAARVPVVVVARVARGLDLYALDNMIHQDVGEERPRWAAWAGIVSFWFLACCAVVGFRRCRPKARVVLWAPVVVVAAATVLFYGGHRIRSSAEPVVVVAAAIAIEGWWSGRRRAADPDPTPA